MKTQEERGISIAWAIPPILLLGIGAGMGLLYTLSREEALEEIELSPGDNTVEWVGPPTYVSEVLAGIIDYVETFYILEETDQVWIDINRDIWDTWAIGRNQICRIVVDRACTVSGFVWLE